MSWQCLGVQMSSGFTETSTSCAPQLHSHIYAMIQIKRYRSLTRTPPPPNPAAKARRPSPGIPSGLTGSLHLSENSIGVFGLHPACPSNDGFHGGAALKYPLVFRSGGTQA